jgi:spore maturation protein CgeB
MNPISFADFMKVPVYKDPHISKVDENGNKVIAKYYQATGAVHVHPDHWDEFLWEMDKAAQAIPEGDDK